MIPGAAGTAGSAAELAAHAWAPAGGRGVRTLAIFHLADVTGPAKSLRPRLEALVGGGGSLEVFAPGEGSLRRAYEDLAEVRSYAYEPLTVPRGPVAALRALERLRREIGRFRHELRRARPELVVVVTAVLPAALIAARLERLPTLVYVGEIFAKGHVEGRLRAIGGRLTARLTEQLADRLVCCSQTVAAQFDRRGKAVTIYPGISESFAEGDRAGFRDHYGLAEGSPVIAVVGNLGEARGQDTAIRALPALLERLPAARLVVAGVPHPRPGDEAFARGLRDLVSDLGLEGSVVFTGFVEQVADVYAAADVVVNPARFNEPFGRVALEALVAGRPVVASAVGAIPEVLRDGTDVLLVSRDDPRALAQAVARVVEDPELSRRLVAEGGRRAREEFGEARGVEEFERLVDELLAGRAAHAAGNPGASAGSALPTRARTGRVSTARALARDYAESLVDYARSRETLADVERYVMFAGYPRSGHSLVGSLLNAHPDAVVAHELDALRYVRARFSRGQILALLLARDRDFEMEHGRAPGRYDYRVPGQWQGRARRLRVLGDKKGGATTGRLAQSPDLLERLRATVRLPLRIIHVTRSPFDNIAAIHKMERARKGFTLERSADFYFELAESNAALEKRVARTEWLELAHEDLVDEPAAAMRRLCEFVGVEPGEEFLRECAAIVYPSAHRTRADAPWTPGLIEDVRRRARGYPFLERYAEDPCAAGEGHA